MFKRFIEVFICGPIFIIGILLNIIIVASTLIWGPIYYIFTGNDPLQEEISLYFCKLAGDINDFILKHFNQQFEL